jgi:hypothetical protein
MSKRARDEEAKVDTSAALPVPAPAPGTAKAPLEVDDESGTRPPPAKQARLDDKAEEEERQDQAPAAVAQPKEQEPAAAAAPPPPPLPETQLILASFQRVIRFIDHVSATWADHFSEWITGEDVERWPEFSALVGALDSRYLEHHGVMPGHLAVWIWFFASLHQGGVINDDKEATGYMLQVLLAVAVNDNGVDSRTSKRVATLLDEEHGALRQELQIADRRVYGVVMHILTNGVSLVRIEMNDAGYAHFDLIYDWATFIQQYFYQRYKDLQSQGLLQGRFIGDLDDS